MNNYKFKFSVIVPIYNAEDFIAETIESVINQSVGFKENIQLILVNDGSADNSEKICLKYAELYPDNIQYYMKKNGGVSSARNFGRKYVEGKYLNFLDADDIWEKDAFKYALDFFDKHYDEIDVIIGKTIHFGEKTYEHPLNFKFDKGTRVVDLNDEFMCIQLGNAPCFFKTEAIENLNYNEKLFVAEDFFFIANVLLKNSKCGLVSEIQYFYRKLLGEQSLSTGVKFNKKWYFELLHDCHDILMEMYQEKLGYLPKFLQYMVFYELSWRIYKYPAIETVLTDDEISEYKAHIVDILQKIDDDVIYKFKNRSLIFKKYIYEIKYGKNILKDADIVGDRFLYYNDNRVFNFRLHNRFVIDILEVEKNGNILIQGRTDINIVEREFKLYAQDDKGNKFYAKLFEQEYRNMYAFDGSLVYKGTGYTMVIPKACFTTYNFYVQVEDYEPMLLSPGYRIFTGLNDDIKRGYVIKNNKIIQKRNTGFILLPNTLPNRTKSELRFMKDLKEMGRTDAIKYRMSYFKNKSKKKKDIWIVRDRLDKAGDSGESVFKYLSNWKDKDKYDIYFLLAKTSKDYDRLKQYGKILDPMSDDYKMKFLLSSKLFDSIVTKASINPFGNDFIFYNNLMSFDYIGLFHGIGQRDMSYWTNKFNYNIKIYVSGARKEYEALLKENNGYDESVIKMVGLPRFDELKDSTKKVIAFMPTWRDYLAGPIIPGTTMRARTSDFHKSDYCVFYNRLINDERLLDAMRKNGYTGVFYNHPNFRQQFEDFKGNDVIKISEGIADSMKVISDSALLITDYSSIFFEMAYMNKPVVYTQFDRNFFLKNHTGSSGYYDYSTDAFGPVCDSLDSSVEAMISFIENDCKNEEIYTKRSDEFFAYRDHNNCERLINEVLKLDKE